MGALLPDDHIVQLVSHDGGLYALTSLGFILKADNGQWAWRQVPCPLEINLTRTLQEAPDGTQETK